MCGMTQPIHPIPRVIQQLDPHKERLAAQRAQREMRTAVIVITTCVALSVIAGVLILAFGHFGF
jgi:hypothetical protein